MTWKFWKWFKTVSDETVISVVEAEPAKTRTIYVSAQTSDKALSLYEKLKEKTKK